MAIYLIYQGTLAVFCVGIIVCATRVVLRSERRLAAVYEHVRFHRVLVKRAESYPVGSSARLVLLEAILAMNIDDATGEPNPPVSAPLGSVEHLGLDTGSEIGVTDPQTPEDN